MMLSLIRFSLVLCFAVSAITSSHRSALAENPQGALPPPGSWSIEDVEFVEAKIEKGSIILKRPKYQFSYEMTQKEVVKDGKKVIESAYVLKREPSIVTNEFDLEKVKVTDNENVPIPADKLKERLKELTPAVASYSPLANKYRKLFKDETLFIEVAGALPTFPRPTIAPAKP